MSEQSSIQLAGDAPKPSDRESIAFVRLRNANKLLTDLVDVETEIQAAISALRAMEIGIDNDDQVVGQIQLVQVMLDCSLRYLAKNALRYESGKLFEDDSK